MPIKLCAMNQIRNIQKFYTCDVERDVAGDVSGAVRRDARVVTGMLLLRRVNGQPTINIEILCEFILAHAPFDTFPPSDFDIDSHNGGGGANSLGEGDANIRFCQIFPKNCMKLKEFGPRGGRGRASKILLCRSAIAYGC